MGVYLFLDELEVYVEDDLVDGGDLPNLLHNAQTRPYSSTSSSSSVKQLNVASEYDNHVVFPG